MTDTKWPPVLDRGDQVLRTKSVTLLKVLWQHHSVKEATWKSEDGIREKYMMTSVETLGGGGGGMDKGFRNFSLFISIKDQ